MSLGLSTVEVTLLGCLQRTGQGVGGASRAWFPPSEIVKRRKTPPPPPGPYAQMVLALVILQAREGAEGGQAPRVPLAEPDLYPPPRPGLLCGGQDLSYI